jgi:carboxypeptidase C (cathepsin A)
MLVRSSCVNVRCARRRRLYTEMGYFQVSDQGETVNPYAWNKVANMLYLESPAGSGQSSGFSACVQGGKDVACKWDDKSQAEAYAHTLGAFKKAFPEFASNELYLTGESYFGQCSPRESNPQSLDAAPSLLTGRLSLRAVLQVRP